MENAKPLKETERVAAVAATAVAAAAAAADRVRSCVARKQAGVICFSVADISHGEITVWKVLCLGMWSGLNAGCQVLSAGVCLLYIYIIPALTPLLRRVNARMSASLSGGESSPTEDV